MQLRSEGPTAMCSDRVAAGPRHSELTHETSHWLDTSSKPNEAAISLNRVTKFCQASFQM